MTQPAVINKPVRGCEAAMAWHFPFPSHVDDMLPNMRSRRQTWHMVLSMDANPTTSRQQSRSRPGSRGRPTPCRAEVQSSGVTKSDTSLHLTYELGAEDRGGGLSRWGILPRLTDNLASTASTWWGRCPASGRPAGYPLVSWEATPPKPASSRPWPWRRYTIPPGVERYSWVYGSGWEKSGGF